MKEVRVTKAEVGTNHQMIITGDFDGEPIQVEIPHEQVGEIFNLCLERIFDKASKLSDKWKGYMWVRSFLG